MKKKTLMISVLVLIGLVMGCVFFLTRPLSLSMEQIFPSGTLMYARLSHVAVDIDQFTQTVFWRNVSTIDLPKLLEQNNGSAKDVSQLRTMQKEMETFLKNPLTKKFLGKEVAVGFYKGSSIDTKSTLKTYDVLLATRLGLSLQMAELFVSMAHQWGDDITTKVESYRGHSIVHVHFNKRKLDLEYLRIHEVLFASFSPSDLLHQVIDVYQRKRASLAGDPDFSKALSHAYQNGHGMFYVNIHGFYDFFKEHIPDSQKENLEQILGATAGFNSYTVSFMPGDVSKLKLIMRFEPTQLNPYWHSLLSCPPSANESLKFVPHNITAYQWGQCYDFKDIWGQVKGEISPTGKANHGIMKWKQRIEKRFKLNIHNEVLPILGSQVGFYLNDIDTQGLFPYPRGVVFIKIINRTAAEGLMKRLTRKSISLLQQEDYQQVPIHYLVLPLGANMEPGYAFLGDYLLLGSSRELLKISVDAFNNSNQSVQSDEVLRKFNMNASDLSHGMAFIKTDDVAGRLEQLLDWYNNKVVSSQINSSLTYEQKADSYRKELEDAFVSKKQELKLARNKIKLLKLKDAQGEPSIFEEEDRKAEVDHLVAQVNLLREDLTSYEQQKKELEETLISYQQQAESAKAWLFNSDEVFMPFLKGLEGFQALGMQLHLGDQISEAEIFIK